MWYSNPLSFPFQEIYKEYAQINIQKQLTQKVLDGFIRTCSGKTSEDGHAKSEHELESIRRMEVRRTSSEVMMVSRSKLFKVRRQKMLCTKADGSDIQTLLSTKGRPERKYKMKGCNVKSLTSKRNVR